MADLTPLPTAVRPASRLEQVGRYRILDRIGKGAMGVVYAARDEAIGRDVALKVMMADLEGDPDIRARFFREAQVAAKLVHRNIVTVFDIGEEEGRLYIVMELLRGSTLGDYLKQTPPDLEEKLDLMTQICDGLGIASAAGVFHRDVKPGNLFVQKDGSVKILDFGIARLASSSMTASGFIVGTPDYMSPEQARGIPVDERSDIFSAGAVFYYMLTGRKPFQAPDLPAVLHKVLLEDPLPFRETEAPPTLARIVLRALAKDPGQRYQRFKDLSADLIRFGRRFTSDTRAHAAQAFAAAESLTHLAQEEQALSSALELPAPAPADYADEIAKRHPELAARGLQTLKSAPLRRRAVERIAADIESIRAEQERRLGALRAAHHEFEAGIAAPGPSSLMAALQHLEAAALAAPDSPAVQRAVAEARRRAADRRIQEDQVRALLAESASEHAQGRLVAAFELARQAASIWPDDEEVQRAVTTRQEDVDRWLARRREAAERLCHDTLAAIQRRDVNEAEDLIAQLKQYDPSLAEIGELSVALATLRREIETVEALRSAADAAIAEARAQFDAGNREAALQALGEFMDGNPGAPGVADEIARLQAEHERLARDLALKAEAARLIEQAAAALKDGRAAPALEIAESALAIAPGLEEGVRIAGLCRAQLREEAETAARLARAAAHLEKADRALHGRRLGRAIRDAQTAAALDPSSPRPADIIAQATRLQQELQAEHAKAAAAASRLRAARPLITAAHAALKAGDAARASWTAENALALDPGNVEAREILAAAAVARSASASEDTVDVKTQPAAEDTAVIRLGLNHRVKQRADVYASALAGTVGAALTRATRVLSRLRSQRGQTTTEWLMIAGLLTAMVVAAGRYIPALLRDVIVSIAWGIRTIAP